MFNNNSKKCFYHVQYLKIFIFQVLEILETFYKITTKRTLSNYIEMILIKFKTDF